MKGASWFDQLEKALLDLKAGAQNNQTLFNSFRSYIESFCRRTSDLESTVSLMMDKKAKLFQQIAESERKSIASVENQNLQNELLLSKQQIAQKEAALEEVKQNRETLEKTQKIKDEIEQTQLKILQSEDRLKIAFIERDNLKAQLESISRDHSFRIKKLEAELSVKESKRSKLQNEVKNLDSKLSDFRTKNSQLGKDLQTQDLTIEELKQSLKNTQEELETKRKRRKTAEDRFDQMQGALREHDELHCSLEIDRARLAEAHSRAKKLEMKLMDQLEEIERLRQINALLKSKTENNDLPSTSDPSKDTHKNEITQ